MTQIVDRSSASRQHHRRVDRAWECFQGDVGFDVGGLRPEVIASWHRSRAHRVSPHLQRAPQDLRSLCDARRRHRELIAAAAPVMAETGALLSGLGGIVLLCGPDGLVLETAGAPPTLELALDANIAPGGIWTEEACGTNAVGTALREGRAVELSGTEHYCDSIRRWTCAAGLLRDPRRGRLLGALDISYCRALPGLHALPLAVAAARRIEGELERRELRRHCFLLEQFAARTARYPSDGLILLDRDGSLLAWTDHAPPLLAARGLERSLRRGMPFDPWLARLGLDTHDALSLEGEHAGQVLVVAPRATARSVAPGPDGERSSAAACTAAPGRSLRMRDRERETILEALRQEQGHRVRTAARLGLSRTTLYRRLLAYGIGTP